MFVVVKVSGPVFTGRSMHGEAVAEGCVVIGAAFTVLEDKVKNGEQFEPTFNADFLPIHLGDFQGL